MGTVIINGQTYDAITGLPVNSNKNDFADCGANSTLQSESRLKAQIDAERRAILGGAVSNNRDNSVKAVTPRGIKHEVETAAKTVVERAHNCAAPDWINNYIQGGAPREIQPVTEQERDFRTMLRNRKPISVKRQPGVSQTLNRRYVRRPNSEAQDKIYTQSIAIDQYHKSKAMRKLFDSKVAPVRPVLSKRQSAAFQSHNARSAVTTVAAVAAAQAAEQRNVQRNVQQATASTVTASQQAAMKVAAMRAAAVAAQRNAQIAAAQRATLQQAVQHQAVKHQAAQRQTNKDNSQVVSNVSAKFARPNTGRSLSGVQRPVYPRPIQNDVVKQESQTNHIVSNSAPARNHSNNVERVSDDITSALIHADELRDRQQAHQTESRHEHKSEAPLMDMARAELENTKKQEIKRGHRKFKLSAIAAAITAVALVLGYGGYLVYPNVQLRIAASQAGLDAKTFYAPKGYKVSGSVAMGAGKLAINYHGENNASYRLNQERSKTTEEQLKSEATVKGKDSFDSLKAGDVNVYRYNDKAAWVKDGVLYTLDTNDFLTSDQITKIASSVK